MVLLNFFGVSQNSQNIHASCEAAVSQLQNSNCWMKAKRKNEQIGPEDPQS